MHCKTAPTAVLEASVIKQVGALVAGYESSEAFAKAPFVAVNVFLSPADWFWLALEEKV